ncbi:MAG TPA: hypothetical protein VLB72_06560 [Burkholderiales bacterium]|nr:hypothetical protein [Burkholderiales bacterium]HSE00380.1 hypothetical protein [Burkholderiales bacterium]
MFSELTDAPLFLVAAIFGVLGVVLILAGIGSFIYLQLKQSAYRVIAGLLLLTLGTLAGSISAGMLGYRALTREEVAAHIVVKPTGKQRFLATFRFPDGRESSYELAGDEIYVDAHILKWHPYANMIGLHTAYEIDRVAGRYHSIKDEKEAMRTVHALARDKPVDLYALGRRYTFIAPVLDTEYGSATFVPVTRPAELELRVSTTGLLMRETKSRKP